MSLQSKREWVLPKDRPKDVVEYILERRGITNKEEFLNPQPKDIPSFRNLYDSENAAKRILKSVKKGDKILIHGDFDSDGICATSLLWEFLYRDLAKFLNKEIDVLPYIPSRIDQGYGLTEDSLNDVIGLGAKLLISVDCGVRDKELIQKYIKEKDLDFVITDHHQPPADLFEDLNYPLVHQMYSEKEYPFQEICGTAVVFLLVQAIKELVGMDSDITENTKGLDLVALSTVTDIMPLRSVNRVFVTFGLMQMRKGTRLGLKTLCLRAGIDLKSVETYHLGYILGPRVNAAGRIGAPMDAVRLLVSENEKQCVEIANSLENLNFDRQRMTEDILAQARESIGENVEKVLFVLGNDWHEGVIGLVAGKLQEQFHRPVLVATNNHGVIKGSARSISGFNITKALEKHSKYLHRYGGHELAAGFTAKEESIESFIKNLVAYGEKHITDEQLVPKVEIDLHLESDDVNYNLVNSLKLLEPLGHGNQKPTICLTNLVVVKKQTMGKEKNHMKLVVKGNGIDLLTLLMFNCLEDIELITEDSAIDVLGYPDINVWNGNESIQFNIKEWRFSKQ